MNIIDQIILKMGEKSLFSFREKAKIIELPIFPGYTESIPLIEKIYQEVGYWHGTGRYQYAHSNVTRYESLDTDTITDLLESIIQEGGLRLHDEPWLRKIQKMAMPTVSLSPFRMYAKLYAGLYLYEKDTLEYQFGTTKIWFRILLRIQMLNKNFLKFLLSKGLFQLARISTFQNTKLWVRSIRKDGKNSNLLKGHLIRSDIPGNYPILIGIKKNISLMYFNPGMERLEARTDKPVRFEDMTHIEVPLAHIEDTRTILKKKNVQLPVIPLEYGEFHCAGKSLSTLTRLETQVL